MLLTFGVLLLRLLLVFSAFLLGLCLGIYVIRKIAAKLWGIAVTPRDVMNVSASHIRQMAIQGWNWMTQKRMMTSRPINQIAKKATLLLLGLLAGALVGYGYRDYQRASNIFTYTNVYIQEKINDHRYLVQPALMRPLDAEICQVSTVDWNPGETLVEWTFEQKKGCKQIISYHKYLKGEKLNATLSVQTR